MIDVSFLMGYYNASIIRRKIIGPSIKIENSVRVRNMRHLRYGFSSHKGNIRSHNEDSYRDVPEAGLWVVADGMGGHKGGETASAIAADFIVEKIKSGTSLTQAIEQAHHAIKQASKDGKGPEGMGTTVVALRISADTYEIGWVGDCRAYLWDGISLKLMTKDHSYVQRLIDTGVISIKESENHPYQDVLIQALGAADIKDVVVDTVRHELYQNEQILLCSDGLTKEVSDAGIAEILSKESDEQNKVDLLIQTALKNGGKDNITAVLVSAKKTAPVRQTEGDTVPIDTKALIQKSFFVKIFDWFKRIFDIFS